MASEPIVVPMVVAVSAMALCVAWRCRNEKERNRQEGYCNYPSHFYCLYYTYTDESRPGADRCQRFDAASTPEARGE
jgi:hypothetical protein